MDPVAFHIGSYPVYWYGIIITTGAVLGAWLASWMAEQRGEDPDHIWNMLIIVLVLGIIGARLYHVFSRPAVGIGWDYYKEHPADIFIPHNGGFAGLGIYGGFIGGVIGVLGYTWYQKLNFLEWGDFATPGLLLAQAIGRWGNFMNQELFGPPTKMPWGIKIDCINRQFYEQYNCNVLGPETRFHPTFLYEGLWNLTLAAVLVRVDRRGVLKPGRLIGLWVCGYGLGRLWVESLRIDHASLLAGVRVNIWVSLVAVVVGGAVAVAGRNYRDAS